MSLFCILDLCSAYDMRNDIRTGMKIVMCYHRPHPKGGESNVFTVVCLLTEVYPMVSGLKSFLGLTHGL